MLLIASGVYRNDYVCFYVYDAMLYVALDCLSLVTELSRSPPDVSGTLCRSASLQHLRCHHLQSPEDTSHH